MNKIFILHGWTYTTDKWPEFCSQMAAAGYIPVMLRVPGLTETTDKVWTLADYVEWLAKKLTAENDKVILIGHSNGGRIAWAFAAKYPEKLKLLVLIDSAGIHRNELPKRLKRFVFGLAAKIGKKITSSEVLRKVLYKLARESDYKNATPQMRKTMVNLISADLIPDLPKIATPTLIIWGRQDKATPLADGKLMHKLIKISSLYIIDKAGHSPHATHAAEVSAKILKEINVHI